MVEHTLTDKLREAEHRLQAAQLAGDIAALDHPPGASTADLIADHEPTVAP